MTQDPPKDKTKALYDELGIPMPNAQETQGKVGPAPSEEKPSSDKKQALYDALGISSNVGAPRIKPPVEQPFTEAPAQGPQTPQQKFEQAIPAGPSMPSATQQEPLSGTLTDSRGPSVVDTPKANYELPPETADISKAKPYGETFSKQEVATAGPGRSEKAEEDRLFLDRFADLDLKGIEKYKDEVLPRQMNVLKQAQAGYNADDKQVGFSEVDLLGLKQQAERDPSLIPEYEQRVKEHNGMVSSLNKQKMAILDLVGAYERDEKLLSMQELSLKREKGSWGGAVWNSILQGEGDVLSGMAGAAANKLLGLESDKNSVLGSLIFPKGFMAKHLGYEPGTTPDEIAKDFRENTLSEMRGVPKEKLGSEGTTDEYIANKSEGFWGGAFLGLARSAPAMATPAMSGIGFQVFDGTMEEMSGPGFEGVSEAEKMSVAAPIAAISMALERVGFRNLKSSTPVVGEIYKRVLAKVPANATAAQLKNAVNGEVSGWVSNSLGKLAGGAASEFETGFFQEGATMAAKDLYDITAAEDGKGFQLGNSWRDYAKNMFYSGAQEAAGGMMMATPYAVSAAIKKNEVGKITSDTQYELVEELATDPNFRTTFEAQQAKDVEEGRITPEQSEEIKTDFATARKIVEKIPDDLPVTSKREAFDILSQIDKLSKKDADLVGDKVQALRERLKGLQGVPKVEEAKTDADGKKVEAKPTEPTGNETKERSTLAETKEDGTAENNSGSNATDPLVRGRVSGSTETSTSKVVGEDEEVLSPNNAEVREQPVGSEVQPVSGQAATDPSTEASSEVQPQEQPATPEYAEYYVKPKLTLDVADDPVALASAYMEEHTGASDESTLDDHIGSYISNNVDYQSFVDFDDVSNVTDDMERAWLRREGGKPLDVLAQEISGNFGGTVTEQDIADYIKANPFGKRNVTERAKEFANRYEGITGRKMNSLVAKKILGDNVSKRGKNKGNKIKAKGTEWTKAEQEIVDYAASQNVELGEVLDKDIEEADNLTEEDFELIFGGGRLKTISQKTKERNEKAREEKQVQRGSEAQDAGDLRGGKSQGADTRKGEGEEGVKSKKEAVLDKDVASKKNKFESLRTSISPKKGDVRNRSKVIKDLSTGVGRQIFFAKTRRGAAGTYSPGSAAVKIKYAGDLDVTAHEIGHALDDIFGLTTEVMKNMAAVFEARALSVFGSKPKKGDPNPAKYIAQEGVAEYIRALVVNPSAAKRNYPEITKMYDSLVDDKAKETISTFSDDVRAMASATGAEVVMSNVDFDPRESKSVLSKVFPKGDEVSLSFVDKMKANWLDPLTAMSKAMEYAMDVKGMEVLSPPKDPYLLARLLLHSAGKTSEILESGMINSKNILIKDEQGSAKNLNWLLDPLDNTTSDTIEQDIKDVSAYMIAERTVELAKKFGRNSVLTGIGAGLFSDLDVAQKTLTGFNEAAIFEAEKTLDDFKRDADRLYRIKEAARRYREMATHVLEYMRDKGRISIEQFDQITSNNLEYVALNRVMESGPDQEVEVFRGSSGKLASVSRPVNTIKGSTRKIKNPYLSLMDSINKSVKEADRNEVMVAFTDLLKSDRDMHEGAPEPLSRVGTIGKVGDKNSITVFNDGKPEAWILAPDVYKAVKGLDNEGYSLPGLVQLPAKVIRWTVTHFPVFAARNVARDIQARMIMSTEGSGMRDLVGNKEHWHEVSRAGGLNAGFYLKDDVHYYGLLKEAMGEIAKNKKFVLTDPARLSHFWHVYENTLYKSETVNRVAEYRAAFRKAKKQGMSDYEAQLYGAFRSSDLIDFALAGHHARVVNQVVPFFNAMVQGLRSAAVHAERDPAGFAARVTLFGILPNVALWILAHSGDDDEKEEYEQIPAWQRDLFYNIKIGKDKWLAIPKPFELGIPGAFVERMMSRLNGNENAFEGFSGSVSSSFFPEASAIAGPGKIATELMANYDFFREKPIVPSYEETLLMELRDTEGASRFGQMIQEATEIDARKIDHFVNSQFTYFGKTALKASNIGRDDNRGQFDLSDLGFFRGTPAYNSVIVSTLTKFASENGLTSSKEYKRFKAVSEKYFNAKSAEEKEKIAKELRDVANTVLERLEKKAGVKMAKIKKDKKKDE
jgi:hypothetical protein